MTKRYFFLIAAVLMLFATSSWAQTPPTDNAYTTFLAGRNLPIPQPHWTDSLKWSRTFNIQNYAPKDTLFNNGLVRRQNWLFAFYRAQDDAIAAGGGVIYFPALPIRREDGYEGTDSSYYFGDDMRVKANIIIRGATPAPDSSDARNAKFNMPTFFEFPYFNFIAGVSRPGGTPNSTAFKNIINWDGSTNNVAIVNVDINRGGIYFQPNFTPVTIGAQSTQWAVPGVYNILVLSVRSNNVVEPSPNVPSNNIDSWHRWPYRFSANVNLFVDRNAIVTNCRINDLNNNLNLSRLVESDNFQEPGYKPSNTPGGRVLTGNEAVFRYTDHYGVIINRLKRPVRFATASGFINYATEADEPSLFAKGNMATDNWIFKTQRVGIHIGGRGLVASRNTIADDSAKVSYVDPTGTSYINPNNPIVTFENRGIDFNGWDARVQYNDIKVYRTILQPLSSIARSADGEGFYSQGQSGVNPRNTIITNNVIRTSLIGLQNAVSGATKKGVNGLTLVNEVQNLTIKYNDLGGTPIELNAGAGTLSNCVIDSNTNVYQMTSIGNNGGLQCYITNNTGFAGSLPLGQTLAKVIQRNCHVSLNPNLARPTVNTNTVLTPNQCIAITNAFACLTPAPSASMAVPRRDTVVAPASTTITLVADFVNNNTGGVTCDIANVEFFADNQLIGVGNLVTSSRFTFDYTLPGNGAVVYISAKADLTDGAQTFKLETSAVQVSQLVLSIDNKLTLAPISLYPNPSNGQFSLKMAGADLGYDLQVTDALGRVIYTGKTIAEVTDLNLAGLSKGIYRVVVSNNGARQVAKLAIQ
jgi:hypothetical protein